MFQINYTRPIPIKLFRIILTMPFIETFSIWVRSSFGISCYRTCVDGFACNCVERVA